MAASDSTVPQELADKVVSKPIFGDDTILNTTETTSGNDTILNTTETTSGNDTILNTTETTSGNDTILNTTETTSGNGTNLTTTETIFADPTSTPHASSDTMKKKDRTKKTHTLFLEQTHKEHKIQQLSDNEEDVKEHQNPAMSTFLEKETFLSALTDETANQYMNPISFSKPKNFLHQSNVCVHTEKDRGICLITGMTLLTENKLILADQNNMSIKMVDMNCHSVVGQLQLDDKPWDITTVSEDMLAITIPGAKMILLVAVSSNHITKKDTIRVAEQCFGIHCHKRKLIVVFQSPAMVQVIDLGGYVQSVNYNDYMHTFIMPEYVTANSSYIYVSDRAVKAVIKLDWHCEEIDTYDSGLGTPEGLAILEDGSVFLSDYTEGKIRKISGDCTTGEIVLKNLDKPFAVCWCEVRSTLYISNFTNEAQIDNFIQIYKMSK